MTDEFKLLFPFLQREVRVDHGVFARELKNLSSVEIVSQSTVDFSRELRKHISDSTR